MLTHALECRKEKDLVAQQQRIADLEATIVASEEAEASAAAQLEAERGAHEETAEALLASEDAIKAERAAHLVTQATAAEALAAEKSNGADALAAEVAAHAKTEEQAECAVAELSRRLEMVQESVVAKENNTFIECTTSPPRFEGEARNI